MGSALLFDWFSFGSVAGVSHLPLLDDLHGTRRLLTTIYFMCERKDILTVTIFIC